MRASVDVRKYGEAVREQGKTSFGEARKLVHAWVGVTDAAYQRVRTELKDLDTRAQVAKLQKQAKRMSAAEVRDRLIGVYSDLAKRGEKVIRDLRRSGPSGGRKASATASKASANSKATASGSTTATDKTSSGSKATASGGKATSGR